MPSIGPYFARAHTHENLTDNRQSPVNPYAHPGTWHNNRGLTGDRVRLTPQPAWYP